MRAKFKDGARVRLIKPCRVDRYWYDEHLPRGSYDFMYLLPGLEGLVIRAKTPCALYNPKTEPSFFANVDVIYKGEKFRVREFHDHFKEIRA